MRMFNPPHPGSVLREYLGNLTVSEAASHLAVSRVTLSRILNARAGISADLALRIGEALGTTPEMWLGMQIQYDLWTASRRPRKKIARLKNAAALARTA
jgi:addiction module HigA family antidote